jgi:site-specific DNA-methyltransferase (adenine-specific)
MAESTGNVLYYGDNLAVLRQHVPDESVDLVYLDSTRTPAASRPTWEV